MRALLLSLVFVSAAFGAKHAPLAPELMAAKTIYIDNQSGYASLADKCYEELTAWGRFRIVSKPEDADVIFRLASHSTTTGYSGSTNNGNTSLSADRSSYTQVDVIASSTKQIMWSDTRRWGFIHSATKVVIKELRKRIEDQEKAH